MFEYEVKRCCGNCEWSISPICEDEIMKENSYEADDPTRPRAGDCCLGMVHDDNYVCKEHQYLSVGLDTYAYYDENDLGPGYYVVSMYYNDVIRYFKLYRTGTYNSYNYGIRVYEIDPVVINNNRQIEFEFDSRNIENGNLHKAFNIFASALGNNVIVSMEDNNSKMTVDTYGECSLLKFSKVVTEQKNDNGYIDIMLKCDRKDRNYRLIEHLFRNLAAVTMNKKDRNSMKKIRMISRY